MQRAKILIFLELSTVTVNRGEIVLNALFFRFKRLPPGGLVDRCRPSRSTRGFPRRVYVFGNRKMQIVFCSTCSPEEPSTRALVDTWHCLSPTVLWLAVHLLTKGNRPMKFTEWSCTKIHFWKNLRSHVHPKRYKGNGHNFHSVLH